jgi:putative flippase GtrA
LKALFQRLTRFWAVKSFLFGGVSTLIDLSVVLLGVEVFGLPRVPCITAGVIVGGSVGFLLNKYFAFKDQRRVGGRALKYALVLGGEMVLHNRSVTLLVEHFQLHYLLSKFGSDFLIFTCLHLLMLRYVVFGTPNKAAPAAESP